MGGSCFFIWRVPPCGAGRGCDFLSDQKVTKESPGPPSMSAYAERALIGGLPRPTGAYKVEIWKCLRCTDTA